MPTFDELLDQAASGNINIPETSNNGGGLWGRFRDVYDKLDQSWLPENDFSKEEYVEQNWGPFGKGLGAVNRGLKTVSRGINDALIGSPVRAAGTAATVLTGPAAMAAKLGMAARPVNLIGRGIDAASSLRSGIQAVEDYGQGNTSAAIGNAVGAGLMGAGATVGMGKRPVSRVTKAVQEAPSYRPVIRPEDAEIVRRSYGPQVQVRPNPNMIGEGTIPLTNQMRGAPGVALNLGQEQLMERAGRELNALGVPANSKNINRYIKDTDFRRSVQRQAEKMGATQRYESTVGTKYVQEAPTPKIVQAERTVDDIRQELISRGIPEPTDVQIARIRKDPRLLDKVLPPEQVTEGVVRPRTVLLTPGNETEFARRAEKQFDDWLKDFNSKFKPDMDIDEKIRGIASMKNVDDDTRRVLEMVSTKRPPSPGTEIVRGVASSMEKELESLGDVGKEIARTVKLVDVDAARRFNQYAGDTLNDVHEMYKQNPKKWEKVVDYLEGKKDINDKDVLNLAGRIEKILDQTGTDLNELGLLPKGTRQNYWPRRYDGVPESSIREAMRAEGLSDDEITKRLQDIKDYRERKISAEFERNELNVPGYRKDPKVLEDHLRNVARRAESAARFGAKDINDPNSPISQMIRHSEDPERARDLVQRIINGGREVGEKQQWVARKAREYATAAHLSLASISNLGGVLPVVVRSNVQEAMTGLIKAFDSANPEARFMNNINRFRQFSGGFAEAMGDSDTMYRVFGIKGTQNYLNRAAGATGHSYAKVLFDTLKENPTNSIVRKQLEDLTLEKADDLLKLNKLRESDLERAMVRMAEITQGVNENRKLPYHWMQNGVLSIPQIFMRTSFQTSKAMYDAVKTDPYKSIPKLLGTGLVVGELVGDAKEFVKTGAQVGMNSVQQQLGITDEDKNFPDEYKKNIGTSNDSNIQDRFSFTRRWLSGISPELAKSHAVVRGVANLEQSFALGLPADILRAMSDAWGDRQPVNKAMSLFWFWDEANNAGKALNNLATGNFRDVTREGLKRVPFVGRGAVREVQTSRQVERNSKGSNSTPAGWR